MPDANLFMKTNLTNNPLTHNRYLYFTVFASGTTTLALELTASDLLKPYFGTSNLVWASIIGLILIYLAAGYFLGGRWADHSPHYHSMYTILAWAAFSAGLIPLISYPVLRTAATAFDKLQIAALFGSFSAVLVLLSIPITLLGVISPFAIRLAITDAEHAGDISGRIYSISTLGSFIGTFLPVLLLTPLVGVRLTFLFFSSFLLIVALVGLWISSGWRAVLRLSWMAVILAGLIIWFAADPPPIKITQGQIYETESAYNYIEVLEEDGYRMLRLNEGQGVHSMWHATQLDYFGPWEQFLVAPFFNPTPYGPENVQRMAIIGLATGTSARQASLVFGQIPIDGFEIDPKIIEVGRQYFDMNEPNLNAIAQDGRLGLEHSEQRYTIIAVDAYRPPYIPRHLTSQEFFQSVYQHLTEDGAMVINVGRSPTDRRLIDGLVGTISTVFPSIYVMDLPYSFNSLIYATVQPTQIQNLYDNLLYLYTLPDVQPLLITAIERMVMNQQPTPQNDTVFTDDWAPIEWITNNMVLNYTVFGDIKELQENAP